MYLCKIRQEKSTCRSLYQIKSYKLIRQGKALRLLLEGAWVSHPSGFEFVDINRPFMSSTLDQIQEQIEQLMAQHKVKETR